MKKHLKNTVFNLALKLPPLKKHWLRTMEMRMQIRR